MDHPGSVAVGITTEPREISDLRPHPRNYRRHPEHQLAILRESLRIHGQQKPVVITPDGTILAGHGLVEAAKAEAWSEIACHVYDGPYPEAFLAIDNRASDLAEDDEAALAALLRDLDSQDQLRAAGWEQDDLSELLLRLDAEEKRGREETFDAERAMAEAEESAESTRVQPGDLWSLGKNRLLCGDATDPANWERLMAGEVAQAIVTDPPYAINYRGGRAAQEERIGAKRRGAKGRKGDAYWDDLTDDEYRALLIGSLSLAHQHSDNKAPLYLWFASSHLRDVLGCLAECGWQERNLLVWVKNNGAGALFAQYKHWYEPCFYAFKRGQAPRWHGPTNERTVWECDKPTVNDLHPTMKPVALIERSITNATELGQLVVDPFLGSGTAIIASERLGRRCYGFDLDARYASVILARWEQFTGQEAVKVDG
ncbi:MAG: DNA modification methylase [Proteobacteria bacterium]|nr:DNA modification methylase [Pseudomonadota bacterium]